MRRVFPALLAVCALAPTPARAQDNAAQAALSKRRGRLYEKLPKLRRDAIADLADRDAILDGLKPLCEWRVHETPETPHATPVGGVSFSKDGRELITCGQRGNGQRITLNTAEVDGPLTDGKSGAYGCAYSPKTRLYATAGVDGAIWLWSDTGKAKGKFPAAEDALLSVAIHPNGKLIAGCGIDGRARVFDPKGKRRFDFSGYGFGLRCCAFTRDGRALLTGGGSEVVEWWSVVDDAPVRRITIGPEQTDDGKDFQTWSVAGDPGGGRFVAGGSDGKVRVHDIAKGARVWAFPAHPGGACAVDWHPKAPVVASGGWGGEVRLWSAADGATLRTFKADAKVVYAVAFNPKLPLLATIGGEAVARLWVIPEALKK